MTAQKTKFGFALEILKANLEHDVEYIYRDSRADRHVYIKGETIYEKSPNYTNFFIPSNEDMLADDWCIARTANVTVNADKKKPLDTLKEKRELVDKVRKYSKSFEEDDKDSKIEIHTSSISTDDNGEIHYSIDGKEVTKDEYFGKYHKNYNIEDIEFFTSPYKALFFV